MEEEEEAEEDEEVEEEEEELMMDFLSRGGVGLGLDDGSPSEGNDAFPSGGSSSSSAACSSEVSVSALLRSNRGYMMKKLERTIRERNRRVNDMEGRMQDLEAEIQKRGREK